MDKLCKLKCLAAMEPHPELYYWFKCPICAYSEFNLEFLHPTVRETASKHMYAKKPHLMIAELWKGKIIYRD